MRWRRSGRTLALIALLAGCRDGFTAVPVTASGVAPLAHAGTGSTHLVGAMVELDARGSFDPDGTLTSFRWSVFAKPPGSAATLHDDSASTSSVVLDKVGSYTFDVEVTDDDGLIDTSRVTFVADPPKITVDAGSNAATLWRTNVALSGSYDVEGGFPATVSWSFASKPAGSLATLANAATLTPSFEPDAEGTFVARLTVKTAHATASDDVEIAASIPRQVLAYDVVDAEYSSALDKIVMVTRNPSRMLMHDPATNTTITIVLAASPRSLSLAPDGLRAVVGFDSFVSTVDLQTQAQSAAISIPATISDVVYAADNRVHVFPQGQWANLYTVALATGTITTATNGHLVRGGSRGRLHPDGQKLYFQTTGVSPSNVHRVDVSGSPAAYLWSSPYHGTYPLGSDVWFLADGSALIAGPTVLRTSDVPQQDLTFVGRLRAINQAAYPYHRWVVHSTATGKIITATEESGATPVHSVRVYDAQTFELEKITPIAPTPVNGVFQPSVAMLVAYRSDVSTVYVLAKPTQDTAVIYEVEP